MNTNYRNENILALDLGTNSIGWAIANPYLEKILHTGVNIFPEGVNIEKGKEKSRTQQRREARGQRRNFFRKKYMQIRLQRELIKHELFPSIKELIRTESQRRELLERIVEYYKPIIMTSDDFEWTVDYLFRKFKFSYNSGEINFQVAIFRILQDYGFMELNANSVVWHVIEKLGHFFSMDPYKLRSDAVSNVGLSKHEFGRILYHLSQLRGFSSNRTDAEKIEKKEKAQTNEDSEGNDSEDQGIVDKKEEEKKSKDERIKELIELMHKHNCKTYGQFFYLIKQGKVKGTEKVRGERDTSRQEYKNEFNEIWNCQHEHGTDELKLLLEDNDLKKIIEDKILYFQRGLRSQKGLIGKCKLESHRVNVRDEKTGKERIENRGKPRCPISALPHERFVMLQEINNMFLIDDKGNEVSIELYEDAIEELYLTKKDFWVEDIARKIGLKAGWFIKGKLDRWFQPKENALEVLKENLGDNWTSLSPEKQNHLWRELYFGKPSEKKNQTGAEVIIGVFKKLVLSDKQAEKIADAFPLKGDTKLYGCNTHQMIADIFDAQKLDETTKQNLKTERGIDVDRVWEILFQFRTTSWQGKDESLKKDNWLIEYGKNHWKLGDKVKIANELPGISKRLKTGYGNLSRHAIDNILPQFEKGRRYSEAVLLANLKDVFKEKLAEELKALDKTWENLKEKEREEKINVLWEDFKKGKQIEEAIIALLKNEYIPYQRKSSVIFQCRLYTEDHGADGIEDEMGKMIERYYGKTNPAEEEKREIEEEVKNIKYFREQNRALPLKDYKTKSKSEFTKDFLRNKYNLSEKSLNKLYHPSQIDKYPDSSTTTEKGKERMADLGITRLDKQTAFENRIPLLLENPELPGLKNPVVMQALHEVKHLINAMAKESENDSTYKFDRIRVEVSRELNDKNKRAAYRKWQQDNERENEEATKRVTECGQTATKDNILKYRLWKEMTQMDILTCPYCDTELGNSNTCMNFSKIFSPDPDYNIDHIIPEESSCDSTMGNLILACKKCNQEVKKQKMPSELSNYEQIRERVKKYRNHAYGLRKQMEELTKKIRIENDLNRKEQLKQKRERLRFDKNYYETKYKNFTCTREELDKKDFKERQLPDTGYITKYVLAYLKSAFGIVEAVKGKATANFRIEWSLQPEDEKKDRSQHLHHAKDACVIACMDKRIYDRYAAHLHNEVDKPQRRKFVTPWKTFVKDVNDELSEILVYYKKKDRVITRHLFTDKKTGRVETKISVRGELHNANFFGKVSEDEFVQRGFLNELTLAGYSKIKDKRLRHNILKFIIEKTETKAFVEGDGGYVYDKKALSEKGKRGLEAKIQKEVLQNGFYDAKTKTTVKKVQILESKKNIKFLYGLNRWVEPANNYGAIVSTEHSRMRHHTIYFFDAVKEPNVKEYIKGLIANGEIFLQQGDIFCMGLPEQELAECFRKRDYKKLHQHLYDLKVISSQTNDPSKPFYEFKFQLDAQMGKATEETRFGLPKRIQIQNFEAGKTGWLKWTPTKVDVDRLGNIRPVL